MGIFSKISTILKGYVNSAVESAEDPKIVLEQMLRDLDGVRKETTGAVAECMAEAKRLEDLANESNKQAEIWHTRAVNALKNNNEVDAKDALAQENKYKSQYKSLIESFNAQQEQVKVLRASLEEIENQISDAKRKKNNIVAQDKMNKANEKASKVLSKSAKSNIYESLNRMEEKVNNSKRKIDALRELEKGDMNSRFEKYDDKPSDVDLEALKSEVFGRKSKDGNLDE